MSYLWLIGIGRILPNAQNPTILHWPHHLLVDATHSLVQIHLPCGFKQHNTWSKKYFHHTLITLSSYNTTLLQFKQFSFLLKLKQTHFFNAIQASLLHFKQVSFFSSIQSTLSFPFIIQIFSKQTIFFIFIKELL